MNRREFILASGALVLASTTGCRHLRGGSSGGYSGPPEYAKYFQKGHLENVVDDAIVQMSKEAWKRGYLPEGQLLKWDWDHRIRIVRTPVVGWKYGFPLVENPSNAYPYGAIATASNANTIRIGDDPNYVYKRSLWVHEIGHMIAFVNGFNDGRLHHNQFPVFFKLNNGR